MKNVRSVVLTTALLLTFLTGCAYNALVGHRVSRSGVFYGELGITGNLNELTIERESRMSKLSLLGDGNKVFIQDDVRLPRIEFWGSNNEISVPDYMYDGIRTNNVGKFNSIVKRASQPGAVTTTTTYYYSPSSPTSTLEGSGAATRFESLEPTSTAPPQQPAPAAGSSPTLQPAPLTPSSGSSAAPQANPGAITYSSGGVTYITTPSGTYVTRPTPTGSTTEPMDRRP